MVKVKLPRSHFPIPQELFYLTQVTIKDFGVYTTSMTYGSPSELRINSVVMLLTSSGMEQDLHTNTSKYGMVEYISPIDMLQERILLIYHIEVISWDMHLLHKLSSNGNHINILLSTEPIIFVLMDIVLISTQKKSTLEVLYSFDKILKVVFIIQISST